MAEKNLPNNIEAEQAVLGCAFLSKYALQKVTEELRREDFYLESHAKIYDAMQEMMESHTAIDVMTLTEKLRNKGTLSQVGNVEYLAEVLNSVPTAANVEEYIKIVREKAVLRRLIEEATSIITDAYTMEEDVNEVLDNAEKKILMVAKNRKSSEFQKIQDVLYRAQSNLERLAENNSEITGISTGFYQLDKLTSGFHENELIIIAARPAMGKTAFALNLAVNMSRNSNKAVAIFNMEMSAEQLIMRMLSSAGQVDGYKLRNGRLEHNDWKRINEGISQLADTNIFIDDTSGQTIGEIRAKCRRLAASDSGLAAVVIDYLQLIQGSAKYSGNRVQEVSEISRALKTMAMELGVPVIALAQLSRAVEAREDKRPLMSDLKESGSIEQDADIVGFLYRDDYYNKEARREDFTSISELIIAKHRNGSTDTIELLFKKNTSTFVNYQKEE